MTTKGRTNVLGFLRRNLGGTPAQRTDCDLLQLFIAQRDESAFATLVDRHGSLVHGVCHRILGNPHEADDAFQATFLVLARRASSIRQPSSLAPWLYGVASRISRQFRLREAIRRRREKEILHQREDRSTDDLTVGELRQLIDEELARLPEKYRNPLLLCCLQGKSRDEAAQELGWSVGSLKGRLERGRELLRERLARHGVALSAIMATLTLGSAEAAPPALCAETVLGAMTFSSGHLTQGQATLLAQAYLKSTLIGKARHAILVLLLLLSGGAIGVGMLSDRETGDNVPQIVTNGPVSYEFPPEEPPVKKAEGPLPVVAEPAPFVVIVDEPPVLKPHPPEPPPPQPRTPSRVQFGPRTAPGSVTNINVGMRKGETTKP